MKTTTIRSASTRLRRAAEAGLLPAAIAAIAISGCGGGEQPPPAPASTAPPPSASPAATQFRPDAPAGIPIAQSTDPSEMQTLVAARSFAPRNDPFALFPSEIQFDRSQRAEALLESSGGWSMQYEAPEERIEELQFEPQPYRRLAGVLVGDTVSAILVMESGKSYIVKPGMMIPESEWRVVSIDTEKAILRRAGNKKPNEITVRLESPPAGISAPSTGAPAGGRAGAGGTGPPAGGGRPGGRGGRGGGNVGDVG